VETLNEALAAGRRLGYPVTLMLDASAAADTPGLPVERTNLRDGRMVTRAWASVHGDARRTRRHAGAIMRKETVSAGCRDVVIGVRTDPVFGPVITFGIGAAAPMYASEHAVLLPPLNERLAKDLIAGVSMAASAPGAYDPARSLEAVARILVQVSALVCALPWVSSLTLDPVRVADGDTVVTGAQVTIDPDRPSAGVGYTHMAIHPYPIEAVADAVLRDGTRLHLRPIRPEDAELEQAFVDGLSEQTRYFRFFYHLHQLSPAMLARFTQVDYDRELALVAIDETGGTPTIVGVARYTKNPDRESAEFAVVVADAWHGRGVGHVLMTRLIESARQRGLARLEGTVLRANANMLRFIESLGFVVHDDPSEPAQVCAVLELRAP
jgi:acetyltransferase